MMLWLWLGTAWAQQVSGFVELRGTYNLGVDGKPWQLVERFRPTLRVPLGEHFLFSTTAEVFLNQGRRTQDELRRTIEESEIGPLAKGLCTWPEEDNQALGISAVGDYLFVDRLTLDIYTRPIDLRVGRQALQWGSGLGVNPTDPFPEVLFNEPWRPRRGVNAVRATVPIGERHQVQAVVATDDLLRRIRVAARGTINVGGFDLSVVGAYRQDADNGLVGFDLKGTAGVGLWLEGGLHLGAGGYGTGIYEEIVAGLDYSFPVLQSIYVAAQYIRLGRQGGVSSRAAQLAGGVELPECSGVDLAEVIAAEEAVEDPFLPVLTGPHYVMLVARAGFIPELALDLVALQNLGDGTGVLVPTLTARPTGWLDIALSAQLPYKAWGDGGEFFPSPDDLLLRGSLVEGAPALTIDLGGLVPEAVFTLWTRANF